MLGKRGMFAGARPQSTLTFCASHTNSLPIAVWGKEEEAVHLLSGLLLSTLISGKKANKVVLPVLPPPPAAFSQFWQQGQRLNKDGLPSAQGMSAYWKAGYHEQASTVKVYNTDGTRVSLPNDVYNLVSSPSGVAGTKVPVEVQLEVVAGPVWNPFRQVNRIARIGSSLILHSNVVHRTILGDSVWIQNVHIQARGGYKAKASGMVPQGLPGLALSRGAKFYRVVFVEEPLPTLNQRIAIGVFLFPRAMPKPLVELMNSLPTTN